MNDCPIALFGRSQVWEIPFLVRSGLWKHPSFRCRVMWHDKRHLDIRFVTVVPYISPLNDKVFFIISKKVTLWILETWPFICICIFSTLWDWSATIFSGPNIDRGVVYYHVEKRKDARRCSRCGARLMNLMLNGQFERTFHALPVGRRRQLVVLNGHFQKCQSLSFF